MNVLENSLNIRARFATGMRKTLFTRAVVGNNMQTLPGQMSLNARIKEHRMFTPPASEDIHDHVIPIRICPHCGYVIRTWIDGELSCIRCENDLYPGEGVVSVPILQAQGTRDLGSRV